MTEEKALFAFDDETIEVPFNGTPKSTTPTIIWHRLRKPTEKEMIERSEAGAVEVKELNARELEVTSDEEPGNIKLWNRIALAVKGYDECKDEWRELNEDDKAIIRPGHKVAALAAMYASSFSVESTGLSMSGQSWTIVQKVGTDAENPERVVKYVFREPTEGERRSYKKDTSRRREIRGSRKSHAVAQENLRVYGKLFDALLLSVDGATVGGKTWSDMFSSNGTGSHVAFTSSIDLLWKQQSLFTFMSSLEAELSD